RLDNYIYIRNKDGKIYLPTDPEEYHEGKEIRERKKNTTKDLWLRHHYATKLKENTTVYSDYREYKRRETLLHISIKKEGEDETIINILEIKIGRFIRQLIRKFITKVKKLEI